jgi:hypothetical protein
MVKTMEDTKDFDEKKDAPMPFYKKILIGIGIGILAFIITYGIIVVLLPG